MADEKEKERGGMERKGAARGGVYARGKARRARKAEGKGVHRLTVESRGPRRAPRRFIPFDTLTKTSHDRLPSARSASYH